MGTLFFMAFVCMIILIVMGVVGNSGAQSQDSITEQMFLFNCPDPLFNGVVTNAVLVPDLPNSIRINYTVTYDNSTVDFYGAFFSCFIDSGDDLQEAEIIGKQYGQVFGDCDLYCVPVGWLTYAGDWISVSLGKVQVFFTMVMFILTPINFSIMGFSIADLSGLALSVIVFIYLFCYIFIGAWIYKMVSPFAGGGG